MNRIKETIFDWPNGSNSNQKQSNHAHNNSSYNRRSNIQQSYGLSRYSENVNQNSLICNDYANKPSYATVANNPKPLNVSRTCSNPMVNELQSTYNRLEVYTPGIIHLPIGEFNKCVNHSSNKTNYRHSTISKREREMLLSRNQKLLFAVQENAPQKRGKERITPKVKHPTTLKRAILHDRALNQVLRNDTQCSLLPNPQLQNDDQNNLNQENSTNQKPVESARAVKIYEYDHQNPNDHVASANLGRQGVEVAQIRTINVAPPRFPNLEHMIEQLLRSLANFHDRAYKRHDDPPNKRRDSRRLVCGFHEVLKHLKLNHLKFVFIAKDLEKGAYEIPDENSNVYQTTASSNNISIILMKRQYVLGNTIKKLTELAQAVDCPIILAFKRRVLARYCNKHNPISAVGVINVNGAELLAKELLESWKDERRRRLELCTNDMPPVNTFQ